MGLRYTIVALFLGVFIAAPVTGSAMEILVPTKAYKVRHAKDLKVRAKPAVKGTTFPIPPRANPNPTSLGGSLTFCQVGQPDTCQTIYLPLARWFTRGKTGYIYKGDTCRVTLKEKRIKARCKRESHFATPVGPSGATWELSVGPDFHYCGEASAATGAIVKRDDANLWKALRAAAPLACPGGPTPTPAPTATPAPTPTAVYGSASNAFVVPHSGLLR